MGTITEAQRKWLEGLGVNTGVAVAAPADEDSPTKGGETKPNFDLNSPDMRRVIMAGLRDQEEKDKKEAEQTLVKMNQALADVKAYLLKMPSEEMQKESYVAIMDAVREQFPEVAGLSQWVKDTSRKVPGLSGKLPSPKALMNVVESTVKARGAELGWSLSTGKNLGTVNSDRLLAAYMSELPSGVSVKLEGGIVKLSFKGAALTVETPAGEVDATGGKGGAAVSLKNNDFNIQVSSEGWKEFDPELRGQWQKISDEAATVLKLRADRDKAKLELESKEKNGEEIKADLSADFDKREAEFNLAWKKLQEQVKVTAKATEEKIGAGVAYLKKDKNDKDSVKAGVDAEADLKALQGKLKAYYDTPSIEAVLQLTAAADKVSAKLELTAVKTGVVVTASFEKALDETKAAIEVMLREGKTKIAAELKQKADDLTAKLQVVHETKDLKLAAELEKALKDVRGSIEVAYTSGKTTLIGGANVSSTGEAGGKVQIDIALKDGRTFTSEGDKLSFTANVSTKGYKFEVAFSMGEPVETASLQDLFKDADRQIKELYKLAGDQGVRSIQDAQALNAKMQEVMAPIKESAAKAKTLKKKSEIAASFGFGIEGEWPVGGRAPPPAGVFSVRIAF